MPLNASFSDLHPRFGSNFFTSNVSLSYLAVSILLFSLYISFPRNRNLPPSPGRPIPLIGHLHLMPAKNAWLTFSKWSKELGPLVYVNVFGQSMLILGTHKAASDLLDRRSAIYSERPRSIVAGELMTGGMVFTFASYNAFWKKMRRASQEALANVKKFTPMQEKEAYILCYQLLQTPVNWEAHVRRASNSLMLGAVYGLPPSLNSLDPTIRRASAFVERTLIAASPAGAFLVEYLPWMMYLPRWMCAWRRIAEGIFASESVFVEQLFTDVATRLREGTQVPSAASFLYENKERLDLTDTEAAWIATTIHLAGGETTSTQMLWVLMSLVRYPEVQKKAQEEVDRVVGRERMPTLQDLQPERMPYLYATLTEILRCRGIVPLGIPHRLKMDDHYEGYFIPKGTIVVPNTWAMNQDTNVWGLDAEDFRPERHLDENGNLKRPLPATYEESHVTYGYGRRICIGRHIANNSLRIYTACLLWSFNLRPSSDDKGVPMLPDPNAWIDEGLVFRPEPFSLTLEPRNDDVITGIDQTLEARGQAV